MDCPKCGAANPERVQYCVKCHAPLQYTCPACRHVQDHGGQCEKCGVDFAKYAAMLVYQAQEQAQQERDKSRKQGSIFKQVLLLLVTGGLSIVSFVRSLRGRD